ncbi:MAG: hypothetical protein L0210_14645 [Rhodospirillales bacterium]|nr:hypothetical protein [Rhodospirillales bacterium]
MTRLEHERRVEALTAQFPSLFGGRNIGFTIAPGWFPIVQRACAQIDAALDQTEKHGVWFLEIKEKMGGLRLYVNVLPVRRDVFGPTGAVSGHSKALREAKASALSDRIMPIICAAEADSYTTCLFCGAGGQLRQDRRWILTLCDRHAPYEYRHLDLAFEMMTDPDRDPVPPGREQIIETIRAEEGQLKALGISCLGLLPPSSSAAVWRLVAEDGDDAYGVLRRVQSVVAWPLELVRSPDSSADRVSFRDIIWVQREH